MGERDGSCDQHECKECERIQRWSHLRKVLFKKNMFETKETENSN